MNETVASIMSSSRQLNQTRDSLVGDDSNDWNKVEKKVRKKPQQQTDTNTTMSGT